MNIGLIGSQGKMGQRLISIFHEDPMYNLIWTWNRNQPLPTQHVDVIIDFSSQAALETSMLIAKSTHSCLLVGTTGLSNLDHEKLLELSTTVPVFISPNFSLGIYAMNLATKLVCHLLGDSHQISISEIHHLQKKDSPSGTSLILKKTIEQILSKTPPIESIRSADIVGTHFVTFETPEETLTLTHQAHSRDLFAKGALIAAKFLHTKTSGMYTMSDLFQGAFNSVNL